MTRDEALVLLRSGKRCKDSRDRVWRFRRGALEYANGTNWCCDIFTYGHLLAPEFDTGWELVKVRKTVTMPVEIFDIDYASAPPHGSLNIGPLKLNSSLVGSNVTVSFETEE